MDFTVQSVYGVAPQLPSAGVAAPTADLGVDPIPGGWRKLVSPDNPLFWVGVVLAVTLGAAGLAGSVRLGRAKLELAAGQS